MQMAAAAAAGKESEAGAAASSPPPHQPASGVVSSQFFAPSGTGSASGTATDGKTADSKPVFLRCEVCEVESADVAVHVKWGDRRWCRMCRRNELIPRSTAIKQYALSVSQLVILSFETVTNPVMRYVALPPPLPPLPSFRSSSHSSVIVCVVISIR